ncbi:MAG: hypothetical protein PHN38_01555 [Sulfurospirillaceae bacterium]|nr:hypothetical protein [Sulfurospirillaceae bacterium]
MKNGILVSILAILLLAGCTDKEKSNSKPEEGVKPQVVVEQKSPATEVAKPVEPAPKEETLKEEAKAEEPAPKEETLKEEAKAEEPVSKEQEAKETAVTTPQEKFTDNIQQGTIDLIGTTKSLAEKTVAQEEPAK